MMSPSCKSQRCATKHFEQLNTSRAPRLARFFMFAFIIGMTLGTKKRAKLNW